MIYKVRPELLQQSRAATGVHQPLQPTSLSLDDASTAVDAPWGVDEAAPLAGHGGGGTALEESNEPLGFQGGLSLDGKLIPPPAPASSPAAPPPPSPPSVLELVGGDRHKKQPATAASPSAAPASDKPAGASEGADGRWGRRVTTAVLTIAFAGFVAVGLVRAGVVQPHSLGLTKNDARHAILDPQAGHGEVYPVSLRSLLYPTDSGVRVLVLTGEVESFASEPRGDLDAIAELVDDDGAVVATQRALVGVTLNVRDIARLTDAESFSRAVTATAAVLGPRRLEPGARAPYLVVITDPPEHAARLRHVVRLAAARELVSPPPAPSPPAPAAVETATPALEGSPLDKGKGKRKAKLKGKKARGKAQE